MRFLSPFLSFLLTPLMVVLPLSAQTPGAIPSATTDPTDLHLQVVGNETATAVVGSHLAAGLVVQVSDASGAGVPDVAVAFRLPDSGVTGVFSDGTHAAVAYTDATGRAHSAPVEWGEAAGAVSVRITAAKGTAHAGLLFQETLTAGLHHATKTDPAVMSAAESAPAPTVPALQTLPAAPQPTPAQAKTQPRVTIQPASVPRVIRPTAPESAQPSVSIIRNPAGARSHSGKSKWLIIAGVVAVSAGLGVAMAAKSKSGSSSSSTSGISIGTPTISVGHP